MGDKAYRLALPPELAGVHSVFHISMLRKYHPDLSHVIHYEPLELSDSMTYVERPVRILDRKEKILRSKTISLVKVQWQNHTPEEATWELESMIQEKYPELFTD